MVRVSAPPMQSELSNHSIGWMQFFDGLWRNARPDSGFSSNRPAPLFVGQSYFDTTLGKPLWCKTLDPVVWVDATGTAV